MLQVPTLDRKKNRQIEGFISKIVQNRVNLTNYSRFFRFSRYFDFHAKLKYVKNRQIEGK